MPSNIPGRASASLRDQLKVLTHPRLLIIYAVTALGYGGVFTAFTFLAPMMQDLAGFSPNAVSWILLGYGISVAIGNIWGGSRSQIHLCSIGCFAAGVPVHSINAIRRTGHCPGHGDLCLR